MTLLWLAERLEAFLTLIRSEEYIYLTAALLCMLSAFFITLLIIPEIIKIAHSYDIMHDRAGGRKIHRGKIPTFGGLAMFAGFIISTLIWVFSFHVGNVRYLISGLFIIVIIGVRDDFLSLRAPQKLAGQILAGTLLMYFGDLRFFSLHGFLGIYELHFIPSFLITAFTMVVITNAFNLTDGLNGLAGTLALVVFGFYGLWFFWADDHTMTVSAFSMVGALIGFLYYNYRSKIFMGDTGSLLLGFMASAFTVAFVNENADLPADSFLKFAKPVTLAAAVLVYPLYDTIRVFILRIADGRSPFSADREHLHHGLLRAGASHLRATFTATFFTLLFILYAVLTDAWFSDTIGVAGLIVLARLADLRLAAVLKRKKK